VNLVPRNVGCRGPAVKQNLLNKALLGRLCLCNHGQNGIALNRSRVQIDYTNNMMFRRAQILLISAALTCCSQAFTVAWAATYSTNSFADAFVAAGPTGNLANNNYGGGGALAVAARGLPNGEFQTVLKFDLSGARDAFNAQFGVGEWSIQSVSLQLTSSPHNNSIYNAIAAGSFGISLLQNNTWIEGTGTAGAPTTDGVSFNSLQNSFINNSADQDLGTFNFPGGSSGANTYSLGLSPGLVSDVIDGNEASFRMFAADQTVSYLFSSRSAAAPSSQPDLIITAVSVVPEPGTVTLIGLGLAIWVFKRGQRLRQLQFKL